MKAQLEGGGLRDALEGEEGGGWWWGGNASISAHLQQEGVGK